MLSMNSNAVYKRHYRHTNTEMYQKEQAYIKEYLKNKYHTDPEYKERRRQQAKEYYHRMKALKEANHAS